MHPLKLLSLLSWILLLLFQISLLWPDYGFRFYWAALLILPLLVPGTGLWQGRRYTYKWVGFLTLLYFCIGISELVSNPELEIYALGTTISSTVLFLASVYYAKFLGIQQAGLAAEDDNRNG